MAKNRDFSYIPAYDAQLRGWGRGRRRSIVILFGREKLKTRMVWLPDGEKFDDIMFNRFDRILACDGHLVTVVRAMQCIA